MRHGQVLPRYPHSSAGTRCRDGVKVLCCCSYLVWLVFEGSIPTCACFQLKTFLLLVVVLFTIPEHTESLLTELQEIHDTSEDKRRFLWIASYSVETVVKFTEMVAGMWGVVPFTVDVSFESYYSELLAESNFRNPWFQNNCQEYRYFNCFIGRNCSTS